MRRAPEQPPFAPVAVTGLGALSPVGGGVVQTCASIRAGLDRFTEYPLYDVLTADPEWDDPEPLIGSTSKLDLNAQGPDRMLEHAMPAIREAMERARLMRKQLARTALWLALPEDHPSLANWHLPRFTDVLLQRTGLSQLSDVKADLLGHAGVLRLIEEASALLHRGEADACVVVGVDSYFAPERLRALDEARRLKSVRNVDGFLPGEAACALVLETEAMANARGQPILGVVRALAVATEAQPLTSDKQSTGAALTRVFRSLLTGAKERFVLCDLNGESYRAFEWGLIRTRVGDRFGELRELIHPAMSLGDVGAASGAVQIACALSAFERGYAAAPEALVWCASDSGLRAGARIEPR